MKLQIEIENQINPQEIQMFETKIKEKKNEKSVVRKKKPRFEVS